MLKTEGQNLLAPGVGERILFFHNDSSIAPHVFVENKDDTNSAAISYEESDDGASWATIVGTSKSIPPGQSDGQIVVATKRRIALFAQGNVRLDVHVARLYNGDNSDLD